jgi:hypothetical protein
MVHEQRFDWGAYQPTLVAAIGQVKGIILQRFAPATTGPCIVTDCHTLPGMSGGPVFSADGVCGVVTANALLPDGADGSVLSLLYPALPIPLKIVWNPGAGLQVNYQTPLIGAIDQGLVKADGTHRMHRIIEDEHGFRVDPRIEIAHSDRVFDTRDDFCSGRPSTPLSAEGSSDK